MAKPKSDDRDVFDKALDDEDAYRSSGSKRRIDEQQDREATDKVVRGFGGAGLALAGLVGGRRLLRKFSRGKLGAKEMRILTPVATGSAGAVGGVLSGDYPLEEARKRRKK